MARERIDLPQGTLDLLILKTLALGPQHGWAISERIQQVSGEVLQVQQGRSIHRSIGWRDAGGSRRSGQHLNTIGGQNTTG